MAATVGEEGPGELLGPSAWESISAGPPLQLGTLDAPHTSGAAALSRAPPGPGRALTAVRAAATAEEAQDPGGLPVPAAS